LEGHVIHTDYHLNNFEGRRKIVQPGRDLNCQRIHFERAKLTAGISVLLLIDAEIQEEIIGL
jgi:hypothetical protein